MPTQDVIVLAGNRPPANSRRCRNRQHSSVRGLGAPRLLRLSRLLRTRYAFATNALVCAGQRRRLLSLRSGRVHGRRETTPSSPEQPRWKGLGPAISPPLSDKEPLARFWSSTPTAGLDPPACLTLAVADPRPWLSFAQPWLNETANSEGIVQAASAPRCRRREPGLQLRVRVRT